MPASSLRLHRVDCDDVTAGRTAIIIAAYRRPCGQRRINRLLWSSVCVWRLHRADFTGFDHKKISIVYKYTLTHVKSGSKRMSVEDITTVKGITHDACYRKENVVGLPHAVRIFQIVMMMMIIDMVERLGKLMYMNYMNVLSFSSLSRSLSLSHSSPRFFHFPMCIFSYAFECCSAVEGVIVRRCINSSKCFSSRMIFFF